MSDGQQIVMRDAWPAMETDKRAFAGFEVAEDCVPGLARLSCCWDVEVYFCFHHRGFGCHLEGLSGWSEREGKGDGEVMISEASMTTASVLEVSRPSASGF